MSCGRCNGTGTIIDGVWRRYRTCGGSGTMPDFSTPGRMQNARCNGCGGTGGSRVTENCACPNCGGGGGIDYGGGGGGGGGGRYTNADALAGGIEKVIMFFMPRPFHPGIFIFFLIALTLLLKIGVSYDWWTSLKYAFWFALGGNALLPRPLAILFLGFWLPWYYIADVRPAVKRQQEDKEILARYPVLDPYNHMKSFYGSWESRESPETKIIMTVTPSTLTIVYPGEAPVFEKLRCGRGPFKRIDCQNINLVDVQMVTPNKLYLVTPRRRGQIEFVRTAK
jgi:hypothetical protein